MNITEKIETYINAQPASKRSDLQELHHLILSAWPGCTLWFLDGKNEEGKVVSNPNIGYGTSAITYADGKTREFYRVGLSANTGGISVYIMGLDDKHYLIETYGKKIGKATVSGYCIKFKSLRDIDPDVLLAAIRDAFHFPKRV